MVFLIRLIHLLFFSYTLLILARLVSSWFPSAHRHRLYQFLCFYTDPYLNLFRRLLPPLGILDLSPILALFALQIAERVLIWLLLKII